MLQQPFVLVLLLMYCFYKNDMNKLHSKCLLQKAPMQSVFDFLRNMNSTGIKIWKMNPWARGICMIIHIAKGR